jgi:hypothetical protein
MTPEGRNSGAREDVNCWKAAQHVPTAKNMETTIEVVLETMFSIGSVQNGYKRREFRFGRSVECS